MIAAAVFTQSMPGRKPKPTKKQTKKKGAK